MSETRAKNEISGKKPDEGVAEPHGPASRGNVFKTVTVAIVEDHPEFREALSEAVRASNDLELLAACRDLTPALSLLDQVRPDVLLVDLGLPSGSGLPLVRLAQTRSSGQCIPAVLTVTGNEDHLLNAIGAGAKGCLFKSDQPDDWCNAIRLLSAGQSNLHAAMAQTLLDIDAGIQPANALSAPTRPVVASVRLDETTRVLLRHFAAGYTREEAAARLQMGADAVGRAVRALYDEMRLPVPGLTPREIQLLQLLNRGYAFKQCAELMGVSESTTKTQAARAYEKLGATNLQSALYEARHHGFLA